MLRITGYSDKYSAFPGEEVKFYVNSEKSENYDVQIVRLIHGDTNPEGPGYKEEEIGAKCNQTYDGSNQKILDRNKRRQPCQSVSTIFKRITALTNFVWTSKNLLDVQKIVERPKTK